MGHLLGAIDQKVLDEQRGVVQNEKRQGENQPYGRRVFTELFRAMYPAGHPYSWPTIGSMTDLDAASLDDVKTWFRTWYGPNNAVLVLAGDIDLATAKAKEIGRAHVGTPVTNAHLVCRLLLDKKKQQPTKITQKENLTSTGN